MHTSSLCLPSQVRTGFFDKIDRMMEKLYQRGQDPNDKEVCSSFIYRTFDEMPRHLKFNMDEVGTNTNKGRKKKVAGDYS